MKIPRFLLIFSFAFLLSVISCANSVGGGDSSADQDLGTTALSIPLTPSRATIHAASESVSFEITIKSDSYKDSKTGNLGDTVVFQKIPVGTYQVIIRGFDVNSKVVSTGTAPAKINAGETTQVHVQMNVVTEYTLSFANDDGSDLSALTQGISGGSIATAPAETPTSSYGAGVFLGWRENGVASGFFDFSLPIARDYGLKAIYGYTVTFNSNGGTTVASQTVERGSTISAPEDPTKTGASFSGWSTSQATYTHFDFTTAISANTTLYAFWGGFESYNGPITDLSINMFAAGSSASNPYTVTLTGTFNDDTHDTIKNAIDGVYVSLDLSGCTLGYGNSLVNHAFRGNTKLISVVLPSSTERIGNNDFENCTGLRTVTIPDSVTFIGSDAFNGCSSLAIFATGNWIAQVTGAGGVPEDVSPEVKKTAAELATFLIDNTTNYHFRRE